MIYKNHRYIAVVLTVVLFINALTAGAALATTVEDLGITHRLLAEERISEGTLLYTYELNRRGNTTLAKILKVDLHNPHVEIRALSSAEGFNDRKTVNEMAKEQGAVAAINGDFFRMDQPAAPFGLHVEDGVLLSAPAHLGHWQGFGIAESGLAQIMNWTFQGKVIFTEKDSYELFGYNQPEHYPWSGNSHGNRINLYDHHWGKQVPGEFFNQPMLKVVVEDGVITHWEEGSNPVAIPENGYVLVADGAGTNFLKKHLEVGKQISLEYGVTPDVGLQTAIGGHALLVENGKPVNPLKITMAGRSARSAIGIDAAGKTVYFVAIEANQNLSGLTLDELAKFLADLGMDRALNVDGGGSSTMVAQELGEFEPKVINRLMYGSQRRLPNAIGVFNRAPIGNPHALLVYGDEGLLLGTETKYHVTGYDSHYHPMAIDQAELVWEVVVNDGSDTKATISNGVLKGVRPGIVNVRVTYQGISAEKAVRVYGFDDIVNVKVIPEEIRLLPNQSIALAANVEMIDGRILEAGKETVDWTTDFGYVKNNTYYADSDTGFGTLTASVDGYTQTVPIRIGGWRDSFFTFREWQTVSFRGHPETLQGDFVIETNPKYIYRGNYSGRLEYDFRTLDEVEDVKIAYGQLGSGLISMGSNVLGVSAYIHGDNSGYWLRAEVIDAKGTRRFVDMADAIDWDGWKRVQGEVNPDWPQPLVLRSIYIVRQPDTVKTSAPLTGSIHIDYVEMIKGLESAESGEQQGQANMTIQRRDQEYPAVGKRLIGNSMYITLLDSTKSASYRISEPEQPSELVYQLGLWNQNKSAWELLPAARLLDTNELMFTLHRSGVYQLFLTPREMLGFTDLAGHWGNEYLSDLVAEGILFGYSDRTLRPDQSVTRAEFVVLLQRVFGQRIEASQVIQTNATELAANFTDDIPTWAEKAVQFATKAGIVQGYNDGTFRAQQQISRTELAVLMGRTLQMLYPDQERINEVTNGEKFTDAHNIPDWGLEHVEHMHNMGFVTGHAGFFRPHASATRAETAVVLWRVIRDK